MNVIQTAIPDVLIIEPKKFGDARGFFLETYQAQRYADAGIPQTFVQDNLSRSGRGTSRASPKICSASVIGSSICASRHRRGFHSTMHRVWQ